MRFGAILDQKLASLDCQAWLLFDRDLDLESLSQLISYEDRDDVSLWVLYNNFEVRLLCAGAFLLARFPIAVLQLRSLLQSLNNMSLMLRGHIEVQCPSEPDILKKLKKLSKTEGFTLATSDDVIVLSYPLNGAT